MCIADELLGVSVIKMSCGSDYHQLEKPTDTDLSIGTVLKKILQEIELYLKI